MSSSSWAEVTLDTLDLWLDPLNPRIDVQENATQEEIRLQLLKHEQVIELANAIVSQKRLLPGDRIITCIEDGKYIVLEGNRRVCACQMLLDPTLIPAEYKRYFPKADSESLVLNINQIRADMAPDRDAAESVLTKRHTEPGIRVWSPVAKMRRVARWFNQGETIDQIAARLGAKKASVRRSIREYHLLEYALNLPGWTQEEKDILQGGKFAVNPYTRFFTLARVKQVLKLEFDEKEYPKSNLPKDIFNILMRCIAKAFLLPKSTDGKPWANTRTTPDEVFKNCKELSGLDFDTLTGQNAQESPKNEGEQEESSTVKVIKPDSDKPSSDADKSSGLATATVVSEPETKEEEKPKKKQQKFPKPARFFEDFQCPVDDKRLAQLSLEIRMVNHTRMPIAATMLLRALLESSLRYHLIRIGKWDELIDSNGAEPGLIKIINFCLNKKNKVFKIKRARDVLNSFHGSGYKEAFDLIVHGIWVDANPLTLEQAASMLRGLITYILNNERLTFK